MEVSVIDDELGGIRTERIVEGNGEKTLRHSCQIWGRSQLASSPRCSALDHTGNLPFWSVLTPETDAALLLGMTVFGHDVNQPSTEILTSSLDSSIVHPFVFTPGAGLWLPWSPSQAVVVWHFVGCIFESMMTAGNIVVQIFKQFVREAPMPIHGTSSVDLGSWDWRGVWLTGRWRRHELLRPLRGFGNELYHGVEKPS